MRRISTTTGDSGLQTSPGTPEHVVKNYGEGISIGWSSDRVQSPANNIRRQISVAALMPFNSGRAPPSKWDDAERWITSPVSGIGSSNNSTSQTQKKPKSKSGPLGPPGVMYTPNYSPTMAALGGGNGNGKYFMASSPLTTGVLVPNGLSIQYTVDNDINYNENSITLSENSPGSSDLVSKISSLTNNGAKEIETAVSRVVSRRDMATQMSPESSTRSSYSTTPPPPPSAQIEVKLHNKRSSLVNVRDVQVDKGVTITRLSKKQCQRKMKKKSLEVKDFACPWVGGASKTSKLQREEAKITAWENLQKAKAEASIRKLEVKLEKKRSESMDKIMNKLKNAQMKAQTTRMSITDNQVHRSSKKSYKLLLCKYMKPNLRFSFCFFKHI